MRVAPGLQLAQHFPVDGGLRGVDCHHALRRAIFQLADGMTTEKRLEQRLEIGSLVREYGQVSYKPAYQGLELGDCKLDGEHLADVSGAHGLQLSLGDVVDGAEALLQCLRDPQKSAGRQVVRAVGLTMQDRLVVLGLEEATAVNRFVKR